MTPAKTVPGVVGECVDAGVRAAVVISAGFKERGPEGAALELEIQKQLRRGTMRFLGPNCLGVMNPHAGFNATFAQDIARPGNVAFLSQSGALLTAILDWSLEEQVGFSAIVSTGSMLDVGWGDLIDYFGDDPATGSILLYMESVGDARSFLSAAREVALRKPIIVIKAGRTPAASKAASSHTGALTGSDEVFDAALRRCGVLRVSSVSDLVLHGGGSQQAAAAARAKIDDPHECGRARRHRHRPAAFRWGRTRAALRFDDGIAQRAASRALEPRKSDRHSRRRRAGALLEGFGNRGERSEQRRVAGHSRAAGNDGPRASRRKPESSCQHARQAGAGKLDGRKIRRGGHRNIERREYSHIFVSGHGGARLHLHVEIYLQPPRPVRNSRSERCGGFFRASAVAGEIVSRKDSRGGPDNFDRGGIEARDRAVRNHDRRNTPRVERIPGSRMRRSHRISRGAETQLGNDYAQVRRGRREAESSKQGRRRAGLSRDRECPCAKRPGPEIFSALPCNPW